MYSFCHWAFNKTGWWGHLQGFTIPVKIPNMFIPEEAEHVRVEKPTPTSNFPTQRKCIFLILSLGKNPELLGM